MSELPFNNTADITAYMRPAKVCLCVNLSEKDIIDAIDQGANTFKKLQDKTGCSTGCGTCESAVRQILANHQKTRTNK